jgi:hypothetical protein
MTFNFAAVRCASVGASHHRTAYALHRGGYPLTMETNV